MDINEAIKIVGQVGAYVDIIEIGTPLLLRCGVEAIRAMRSSYQDICILADAKIIDGAEFETNLTLDAGADIVTVLAVSEDTTLKKVIDTCHNRSKKAFVDMICVENVAKRALEIERMGADYIGAHLAVDVQNSDRNPLDDFAALKSSVKKSSLAVAGGVKLKTFPETIASGPDVIIVGNAIVSAPDKVAIAKQMQDLLRKAENQK
jgi:3-hexulose-6-phosphate synthase